MQYFILYVLISVTVWRYINYTTQYNKITKSDTEPVLCEYVSCKAPTLQWKSFNYTQGIIIAEENT